MDIFLHYKNPSFHSSSLAITNDKSINSCLGKEGDQKKRNKRTNNKMINNKVKLSTDPQSVAARERRHRISEKLKILRSLIPGGDTRNMDTVSMLEEVIQYVKHLKSQILLHQTMISFQNLDEYHDHDHDASRNYNHGDQDFHFHSFDHNFFGEYQHHEMSPQLGFVDQDHMVSISHDHHHEIYP